MVISCTLHLIKNNSCRNYYSVLNDDDDNDIIQKNNVATHYGMLDSGTTDHFISVQANVNNVRPTTNAINVTIPNDDRMNSTHEYDIDWPLLPHRARGGHIIPALSQHSLLSVVKLCENGCKVTFQHDYCVVHYNGKIMMYGQKCPITKLWLVPLHQRKQLRLIAKNNRTSTVSFGSCPYMSNRWFITCSAMMRIWEIMAMGPAVIFVSKPLCGV